LKEWKFLWLPEKKNIDPTKRKIYESRIYSYEDPDLAKIIITIIYNSLKSNFYPIEIFSIKRSYIEYQENNWRWKRITQNEIDKLLDNFNFIINESKSLTLIKYFSQHGENTQSSLVVSNTGTMCVLKQYFGDDIKFFKKESKMWGKIYNIKTKIQNFNNKLSMLLPLAFTCESRYNNDYKKNEVFFQTDLKKIFTHTGAVSGVLHEKLICLQVLIIKFARDFNVYDAAKQAIKKFAEKGYVHNDLHWRHIALLPIFKEDKLENFEPILIDLENVTKEKDFNKAYNIMYENLKILSKNTKFIYVNPII